MGNLIIPKHYRDQWLYESREAKNLLAITPLNKQEEQLIDTAHKEAAFMNIMGLLLGISFCASLKRYFPEAVFTQNHMMYGLTSMSIIIPIMTIIGINSNHGTVQRLRIIKTNHEILKDN